MTALLSAPPGPADGGSEEDKPRRIDPGRALTDRVFHVTARGIGFLVLVLTGSIGVFLGLKVFPTVHRYGFAFFTQSDFDPERNIVGISSCLIGSIEVALIALVIGFPLALGTALFISEYAPPRAKSTLVSLVDLMAAIPSIVYGLWGALFLEPYAIHVSRWMSQHLSFIPIFKVNTNPNSATWAESQFTASAFICGLVVAMMLIPLACSVMRSVFSQAPIGEREAAYALGSTRWGMIRSVVIPFGVGGIIGGTMLALGRALGETVAVLLIYSEAFNIKFKILTVGTNTISALIADKFADSTHAQLYALLAAGFVLFVMTLAVNTVAAIFVGRSRSGAATDA